jgi:glycosyltransferase involved in cell wall biosynthesis
MPAISVIVPNYNHAPYLPARLRSVMRQTLPVQEIVVLDDRSTDNSLAVIRESASADARIRIYENEVNSGNPFRQWQKGIEEISGDLVWIAESDDIAHPGLLEELCPFLNDGGLGMAFCDSVSIGEREEVLSPPYSVVYSGLPGFVPGADFRMPGAAFAASFLSVRNYVFSASAVLWRAEALRSAIAAAGTRLEACRMAGDWLLYAQLCAAGHAVGFRARVLNLHRIHAASVRRATGAAQHAAEVGLVHGWLDELGIAAPAEDRERFKEGLRNSARAGDNPGPARQAKGE